MSFTVSVIPLTSVIPSTSPPVASEIDTVKSESSSGVQARSSVIVVVTEVIDVTETSVPKALLTSLRAVVTAVTSVKLSAPSESPVAAVKMLLVAVDNAVISIPSNAVVRSVPPLVMACSAVSVPSKY